MTPTPPIKWNRQHGWLVGCVTAPGETRLASLKRGEGARRNLFVIEAMSWRPGARECYRIHRIVYSLANAKAIATRWLNGGAFWEPGKPSSDGEPITLFENRTARREKL